MNDAPVPPGPRRSAVKVYGAQARTDPGDGSPVLSAELDKQPRERSDTALSDLGPDLNYRIIVEARQRAASATRGERERVVRASTDRVMAHIGFVAPLAHLFGLLDLLWIGLGVARKSVV